MRKLLKKEMLVLFVLLMTNSVLMSQEDAPGLDIIGYGYDIFGKFADNESKKVYPLFDFGTEREVPIGSKRYMVPQNVMLTNIGKKEKTEVSGSNEREFAKSFGASVGLEIEGLAFGGSVSSSFSKTWGGAERQYFHTIRDANRIWHISVDKRVDLRSLLDPTAAKDIEEMDAIELFELYGTHFIISAYLGGRADFNSVTKITEKFTEQEISAAVGAKYGMVSGEVSTTVSSAQSNIVSNTNWELVVTGGNAEFANDIRNNESYAKWASGIRDLPVLCDFEKGSLRPIWDLAKTPARKAELQAAFTELCKQNPIPEAMADVVAMKNEAFMVKNKAGNLYWDFSGFNQKAEKQGGKLKIWPKDGNIHKNQGFDRVYKIIPHAMQPEWVFIQPQHADLVLGISEGSNAVGSDVLLSAMGRENASQMFKMEPVDGEKNTYHIKNKNSGLYLELPVGKEATQGTLIVQNKFTGADNQKWIFEDFAPENIAQPDQGYYSVCLQESNKYWDFPGSYPDVKENKLQLWSQGSPIGDGVYKIAKRGEYFLIRPDNHPHFVLTAKNNTPLSSGKQTSADDQLFRFEYGGQPNAYIVINIASGQVIDADAQRTKANGCAVSMKPKTGATNQRWEFKQAERLTPLHEGTYNIKMAKSNKYLDLSGNDQVSNKNGANAQLWDMDGGKDRIINFVATDKLGYYILEFQNGKRVLDISGAWKLSDMNIADQALYKTGNSDKKLKKDKGANVQAWEKNNKENQQWNIVPVNNNTFLIVSKLSGKALDAKGGKINENGCNIQMWDRDKNNTNQHFQFIPVGNKEPFSTK